MIRRLPHGLMLTGAVLIGAAAAVPGVQASFPGSNGRILFDSPRSGATRIHSVDPAPVNPTAVAASNGSGEDLHASGSPDGTAMVFASDRTGPGNGSHRIFLNAAATTVPEPVTPPLDSDGAVQLTTAAGDDRDPSFVDATHVVYSHRTGTGPYQLWVVSTSTLVVTQILSSGCNDTEPVANPVNPDQIAFTRECPFANAELMLLDRSEAPSGSNPLDLTAVNTSPSSGQDYDVDQDRNPDWAPDGSRIAVAGTSSSLFGSLSQLYSLSPDGANRTLFWGEATYPAYTGSGTNDRQPAYSPDGSQLAFTRTGSGTGIDVNIGLSDLTSLISATSSKDITPVAGTDDRPAWLPLVQPPPEIPEAPLNVLLPISGAAMIGAGFGLRRRTGRV
jgi:Tol biopolymer transport system component